MTQDAQREIKEFLEILMLSSFLSILIYQIYPVVHLKFTQ